MSSIQMVTKVTSQKHQNHAADIAKILRKNYVDNDAVVKRIARIAKVTNSAAKAWCEGRRTPSLKNFIKLVKTHPGLLEWFLDQVDHHGSAQTAKTLEDPFQDNNIKDTSDIMGLIFETKASSEMLQKVQKLTFRQLWFYARVKKGGRPTAKDLMCVFDISRATAYRDVQNMCRCGLILKTSQEKDEFYISA